MEISINDKYRDVLLEALSDYMYKVSLELNNMKGQSMTTKRKELTNKQRLTEELRNVLNYY